MYVKSLTLKGFKSFASATSMRLEPGITCIVGPNGSGKSNVVDALAWVMGEQGAKSLRGGKMEDVIFAGTPGRPALGRAEVTMTIDNTDGALPIDYTEVTIRRTMFKGGGSEYAINGTSCRLLDVQELLSDSGIGREMHVIVGQGQLDAVLRATPEERRGFIEEAAGVLKHRKRKERALRKLEQMEANLQRAGDLTTEIRRQLGPLGRQAETARKAAVIQAEVRDARLRLLADDLVQLTTTLEQEVADETALLERQQQVRTDLERAQGELARWEQEAAEAAPRFTRIQDQWFSLSSLKERVAATGSLAAERVRLLSEDESQERSDSGRDPEKLRRQAAEAREALSRLESEIEAAGVALEEAIARRSQLEDDHHTEQQRLTRLARAAADRREGLAKLEGQVAARRSRIEAGEAELGRMAGSADEIVARVAALEKEHAALESTIAQDEEGEEGLDEAYDAAEAALASAQQRHEAALEQGRSAERDRHTHQARVDALELSLRRQDGAAHLLEQADGAGLRGSLTELMTVTGGHEAAIAAALGWAADALVADSLDAGATALERLRADDAGRATVLLAGAPDAGRREVTLPAGARWAAEVVTVPADLRPAVDRLLDGIVLVDSVDDAKSVVAQDDSLTAVTADGDLVAAGYLRGGSSGAPSLLEIQSAVDESRAAVEEAAQRGERAQFLLEQTRGEVEQAQAALDAALERLSASDARMASIGEQLSSLGQALKAARSERDRLTTGRAGVEQQLAATREELTELEARLTSAQEAPEEEEPTTDERDRLAAEAAQARTRETDLRLALRTKEEQARSLSGRADGLEAAARSEIEAREKARLRRERRAREASTARAVQAGAATLVAHVEQLLQVAGRRRSAAEQQRQQRDAQLAQRRKDVATISDELRELTDTVHRDEIARAQQRMRIEALQTKAVEELGIEPDKLMEEFGPHLPIPHIAGPDDDPDAQPEPTAFVREEQEKRLKSAERKLGQLGRINPLALEEFAALEERHKFLVEQLEDLKNSKRDLLEIVAEVDERVQRVFAEAFEDTAREFEGVFSRLFPGGEGRLVLTDPEDMLGTGIEVEARPPGKKIKRLSLLSGGERSLVAVALLVSIFKARPSPFYIMDEVEAALDDANLGRLITLFEELRDSSQLIVITHQKRTMEVADALYGVSMRGDGVTTVVSQRIRDVQPDEPQPEPASA
ncbi:chromosome segregation protein SMC [Calidifontibacter sp. DB0510]|uniref:Chromosome partition protein Smc n=1 Tax=Metallococcus carri TaxID=1656884 RepID=A0A967AXU3_9MICO|nr:chromosome segregation protein SMC [Metallococcus carri]NHN54414.1 chromosome segregation protein SMC [Metallococcus carri]NOP36747.1 chromosome segregation protein SMC [Calidifontibacter sp. DB2511S]